MTSEADQGTGIAILDRWLAFDGPDRVQTLVEDGSVLDSVARHVRELAGRATRARTDRDEARGQYTALEQQWSSWCERYIYPLVAALDAAGIEGKPYPADLSEQSARLCVVIVISHGRAPAAAHPPAQCPHRASRLRRGARCMCCIPDRPARWCPAAGRIRWCRRAWPLWRCWRCRTRQGCAGFVPLCAGFVAFADGSVALVDDRSEVRAIGARAEIAVNGRWQPAPIAVVGPETRALVATALRAAERRGLERAAGVCEERAAQWAGRITDADSTLWVTPPAIEVLDG